MTPDYSDPSWLAERCRDAWAVLRAVPAHDGERALRRHGREYDPDRFIGTRDGLADDMLDAAIALDNIADSVRPPSGYTG